ncbi:MULTISPECIES: response regulator transcription factor [unclassified Oceanobacter]|jgi:DNA-binding response OmpR family regulator|uniref:response regulator transcription factor n=1 Tax=unclassified Oceanobacter TaxID=2620260 RepID=UPI0026E48950|nr:MULTISPECIES: response regulator transcription factor [unclassified Oceanobacter]MDO6680809.1 response regulator transcription factor [Oceanobacter sp. 5_MG-2023]MDP2546969.1 response regulator transcription factor [Oceanobacter sp. 4_MG-2023]MDP2607793.1 response regulator transcription factor [Oceanobacter sp. 1_MG-2023]MDP2611023.1 response regulator transcription factor [Oceanobacter sp. 2_MG-2023]
MPAPLTSATDPTTPAGATERGLVSASAALAHRILVIEDEPDIANLLALHLRQQYHHVQVTHDGQAGFELACQQDWSLIVLDLHLPGKDGLEICRDLRGRGHTVPVLMLTSRSSEMDRVLGLEMGADDYLLKPFSVIELMARIKAILRRVQTERAGREPTASVDELVSQSHRLVLNLRQHRISKAGKVLDLTGKEFDLLSYFMQHPEDAFSRAHLLNRIWGQGQEGYEHTVNTHINRLRAKIEDDPTRPRIIVTVWGVGYRLG